MTAAKRINSSSKSERIRKIHLTGVGEISLERSRRAKRIILTVRPFRGVRVAVPRGISFQDAFEVARSNTPWIRTQLLRIQQLEQKAAALDRPVFINRVVAKNIIVERLAALAGQHGFNYNKVFIRNQKTRWGSCSVKNNINLNLHLVRLPAVLMDYVILHELLHTRIKNHGPDFWQSLEELIPNAKTLDRELNRYEVLLTV